jgi:hypothetical protein
VFRIDELQLLVGGHFEIHAAPTVDGITMYLVSNDEAKLHPHHINGFATSLFQQAGGPMDDYIAGNAVVCTRTELGEDDEDERLRKEFEADHDAVDPDDL